MSAGPGPRREIYAGVGGRPTFEPMGGTRPRRVVGLPLSRAQRLAARCLDEERAFQLVLECLKAARHEKLFLQHYSVYRIRMSLLRRVTGAAVPRASATEELRRFLRIRDDALRDALGDEDVPPDGDPAPGGSE